MEDLNLIQKCKRNKGFDNDTFVGLKFHDEEIEVTFPYCYELGKDDETLRKDILLLLNVLQQHSKQIESDKLDVKYDSNLKSPLVSYIYVLKDFLLHGYFKETETVYNVSQKGKINWNRTIKQLKPVVQDNAAYYLNFITKRNNVKENELITLIHEYCVYKAFKLIGWLFTNAIPSKPRLKFKKDLFIAAIMQKLCNTFNDQHKLLFQNMLAIVKDEALEGLDNHNFSYGTSHFEYCWENMIDKVFGVVNKSDYFPTSHWEFNNSTISITDNSKLEPDSIMVYNNKIYVLDAKYYKYGYTGYPGHLPQTADINKQITYGEFIYNNKFKGEDKTVYNAFIIPFNKWHNSFKTNNDIYHFGQATTDWKLDESAMIYEKVQGIVLDLKHLMQLASSYNVGEIERLANEIEEGFAKLNKKS